MERADCFARDAAPLEKRATGMSSLQVKQRALRGAGPARRRETMAKESANGGNKEEIDLPAPQDQAETRAERGGLPTDPQ